MTYVQTRPQLELNVRRRVASLPNVQLRYRSLVEAPIVDVATDPSKVRGVALSDGERILADLVVDASGRNSATARWLPAMGFDPAPETYVNCDVIDGWSDSEAGTGTMHPPTGTDSGRSDGP